MATDAVLDFDRLMTPIFADNPTGEGEFRSLDSTAFFELRKLRDELKKAEDNAFFGNDGDDEPDGDWKDLLEKSSDALATQTKDIQLVCWILEALPRVHGFAGLRDGLQLLTRLVDTHLENLFPQADTEGVHEDGIYTCVEPFDRLDNGPLPDAVERIVVTQGSPPGPFTLWHYQQAVDLSQRPSDVQQERREDGWVTLEMFEAAVRETPDSYFQEIYGDLARCVESLDELSHLLDERCGEQDGVPLSPSVRGLRSNLENAGRSLRTFAGSAVEIADEEETEEISTADGSGPTPANRRTRETAFRELEDIAEFFRKTEPHSVLSYMLGQVVRYGRLNLPDLLQEILRDSDERHRLFRHVGIDIPDGDD